MSAEEQSRDEVTTRIDRQRFPSRFTDPDSAGAGVTRMTIELVGR
ncbi:MAG: hypothetical protein ACRDM7_23140 [Thermoleophilaceae bacterium]